MKTLATIRRWKLARFTVEVTAHEEFDLDLSFDETGEISRKLDSGELVAFSVRARVLMDGVAIATDYLGGCIYESFDAFMDHAECAAVNRELAAKGETGRCGSYFADMVSNVIRGARKHVATFKAPFVRV